MKDETKKLAELLDAELEQHEVRRRTSVIAELLDAQAETKKRTDEHGVAIVVIARAMGVDEKHLPPGLLSRSMPPPASKPAPAQRATIPTATSYTRWAVLFAAIELGRELVSLATYLMHR